jgi:hypothetical protein
MHVFGGPAAVGAATAMAAGMSLNPDVGLALGALTAGIGTLIAGWWVTSGNDRKLVKQLQDEEVAAQQQHEAVDLQQVVLAADPEVRAVLERILYTHASIDSVFADGIDDQVEAILVSSREDLRALRDRAIAMTKLHKRLREIIQMSDGRWLTQEVERMDTELARTPAGGARDALAQARESTARTLTQWQTAFDKQAQVRSVLTMIESNLSEFKLAMELRKADAAMGAQSQGADVSELQARLTAAGDACDELMGRSTARQRRARRTA